MELKASETYPILVTWLIVNDNSKFETASFKINFNKNLKWIVGTGRRVYENSDFTKFR